MIDADGFRANVGIILANTHGQVLWAKRVGHDAWQFPQGGIDFGETMPKNSIMSGCSIGRYAAKLPRRTLL